MPPFALWLAAPLAPVFVSLGDAAILATPPRSGDGTHYRAVPAALASRVWISNDAVHGSFS